MPTKKPIIRYKLTDKDGYTRRGKRGETLWQKGTVRETTGEYELCGPGWTHVYTHPLLAELLDPIHGDYGPGAKLIAVRVSGKTLSDRGLKEGWTRVEYSRAAKRRKVSLTQKTAFGILCALETPQEPGFQRWAENWLSGKDRSQESAKAATKAAARDAAWAARDAAWAAWTAAWATRAVAKPLDLIAPAKKAMRVR